jgi:hypothetical protein
MNNFAYITVGGIQYSVPAAFSDIENKDISGSNFAPSTNKYLHRGFWVKPDTGGTLSVITFKQYVDNGWSTSGLSAVDMYVGEYEWLLTPVVQVNTGGDASNINVGIV